MDAGIGIVRRVAVGHAVAAGAPGNDGGRAVVEATGQGDQTAVAGQGDVGAQVDKAGGVGVAVRPEGDLAALGGKGLFDAARCAVVHPDVIGGLEQDIAATAGGQAAVGTVAEIDVAVAAGEAEVATARAEVGIAQINAIGVGRAGIDAEGAVGGGDVDCPEVDPHRVLAGGRGDVAIEGDGASAGGGEAVAQGGVAGVYEDAVVAILGTRPHRTAQGDIATAGIERDFAGPTEFDAADVDDRAVDGTRVGGGIATAVAGCAAAHGDVAAVGGDAAAVVEDDG